MNKKILIIFVSSFILFSSLTSFVGAIKLPSIKNINESILEIEENYPIFRYSGKILYVGGTGEENYSKIQDAIDNSSDGDIIFVFNGIYQENLKISKRIKLEGENREKVTVDGNKKSDTISIFKDSLIITNLTVENGGNFDAGVKINTDYNIIQNCNIKGCWDGIELNSADNNKILHCDINKNNWSGLSIFDSSNNTIDNCNIHHNLDGILMINSCMNVIRNSEIKSNVEEGIELEEISKRNIFQNNTIIYNGGYGIFTYWGSDETYISYCNIDNNSAGVAIGSILRGGGNGTTVLGCNIRNNKVAGIYFLGDGTLSKHTEIHYNNIYGNRYDINAGNSKRCFVNAQKNWWGSRFGPRLVGPKSRKTIIFNRLNSRIFVRPWLKSPFSQDDLSSKEEYANENLISEKVTYAMEKSHLGQGLNNLLINLRQFKKVRGLVGSSDQLKKSFDTEILKIKNLINQNSQNIENYYNNTLYVGGSGEGNYSKIQYAIDNSSEGDVIFVYNGSYVENLVINKAIKLVGENRYEVYIDGDKQTDTIHVISNGVTISSFTVKNSGNFDAGIKIDTDSNCISNCVIKHSWDGIELNQARFNYISNCEIFGNYKEGIYLLFSDNNTISDCVTYENLESFWLDSSHYNLFENSKIESNKEEGIQLKDSSNNIFYKCKIAENVNGYAFYIQHNSNKNLVYNCTILKNGVGLFFCAPGSINGPCDNIVAFCSITNNLGAGVFFLGNGSLIKNTEIHYNNIDGNKYGIVAISSQNCFVNAQQNWWGSRFGPSLFGIGFGDTISWNLQNGHVYCYPWLKNQI